MSTLQEWIMFGELLALGVVITLIILDAGKIEENK
jgi:hypothetical protein|tara:strand:- start:1388 stop:1492 length:105 start_codon:yes stop_codon:yes gene_type:complete